jgi:hypothetical protein
MQRYWILNGFSRIENREWFRKNSNLLTINKIKITPFFTGLKKIAVPLRPKLAQDAND